MSRVLFRLLAVLTVTLLVAQNLEAQESAMSEAYKRLEERQWKVLHTGATPGDDDRMLQIAKTYSDFGEAGTKFLIGLIGKLNEEELDWEGTDQTIEKGAEFENHLQEQKRTTLTKGMLCLMLADLYGNSSGKTKAQIVELLVASFTPSQRIFHSNPIDWALARVGPAAVDGWLLLADSKDESVRCHFSEQLTDLPKLAGLHEAAPKLDCRAGVERRKRALGEWRKWWEVTATGAKLPVVPSFFEGIGRNAGVKP
jgi:hypothetical protein